jgi:hypothetical protein
LPTASIAYAYGTGLADGDGIVLASDASGALSVSLEDATIASVPYGAWGLAAVSQSIELAQPIEEGSETPAAWCQASLPWNVVSDWGTPGAPSDCNLSR